MAARRTGHGSHRTALRGLSTHGHPVSLRGSQTADGDRRLDDRSLGLLRRRENRRAKRRSGRKGGTLMRYWVGFDVGKAFHWVCVLDEEGEEVLSRKVEATEEELEAACKEIEGLGGEPTVGIDPLGPGRPPSLRWCCSGAARESSTCRASRSTGPETPTRARPKATPRTLTSSPISPQTETRFATLGLPQGRDHHRDRARRPPQRLAPGPDSTRSPPPRGPAGGVPWA